MPAMTSALSAPSPCLPPHDTAIVQALQRWQQVPQQTTTHRHTVSAAEDGLRLTKVPASAFAALGSKSQARLQSSAARSLNGALVEKSRRVKADDELSFEPRMPATLTTPESLASRARFVAHLKLQGLRAVYEDEDVAVVYKPPGIHTKSFTNAKYAALEDGLPAILTPPVCANDALPLPLVMHRLDVPVAGLCALALTSTLNRDPNPEP